ncbi:hypothetical protein F4779DRAFT_469251 [Xylariaceae sp. FL0662B]|nr:hypothetical protein F4779DRAFT_469251 [Xylariaceae sp. FL0662B]
MSNTDEELCEKARVVLEHQIRPREEVTAIRHLLARDLASSLGAEQLSSPLSLIDPGTTITPSESLQGPYKDYVETAQRSLEIRSEFDRLQKENEAAATSPPSPTKEDLEAQLLELQLEVNSLEQKHERLQVIDKYLDELDQQPAASPDFLNPEVMFKGCEPFPELPKVLMDGFTQDRDAPDREIQELLSRLQKAVLRNKLLAQREKQKFEELQARDPIDPSSLPPEVQLHALNAVKDALINWIETMLSKAGDNENEPAAESPNKPSKTKDDEREKVDHEAQMAEIQKEYEHHVELRKEIIASLAQLKRLQPEASQNKDPPAEDPKPTSEEDSHAFLLTPYLEKLQAISREQKGLIQEKSHISAALAKQQEDTETILNHLVEESQLLHKYPAAKSERPRLSFGEAIKVANRSNITSQVEPWIFSAESAKIATLETVAEKVEEGQMAVDDAMQALGQIRKLLNKEADQAPDSQEEHNTTEDDIWLAEGDEKGGPSPTKNTGKQAGKKGEEKSIWTKLDGNLGLLNE